MKYKYRIKVETNNGKVNFIIISANNADDAVDIALNDKNNITAEVV